jgi:hypothetical protein
MRKPAALALLAAALLPAAAVEAGAPAPARFMVEARISHGSDAPAQPRLIVEAGNPATIQIANRDYALRLTATPGAADDVAVTSRVTMWTPTGLVHQDRHAELRAGGAPLRIGFRRAGGDGAAAAPIEIDLRVTPVR